MAFKRKRKSFDWNWRESPVAGSFVDHTDYCTLERQALARQLLHGVRHNSLNCVPDAELREHFDGSMSIFSVMLDCSVVVAYSELDLPLIYRPSKAGLLAALMLTKAYARERCQAGSPCIKVTTNPGDNPMNFKKTRNSDPKENVRFFLSRSRYCEDSDYPSLLADCLGVGQTEFMGAVKYEQQAHTHGVWLICSALQFSRFLVERDQRGIQNWFHEMQSTMVGTEGKRGDLYTRVSERTGIVREDVKRVIQAAGYAGHSCDSKGLGLGEIYVADRSGGCK